MRRAPQEPFEPTTPLHVEVECHRCASRRRYEVAWALVNPEPDACDAEGWDGVLLGRVIECIECGAVDDYELTPMARLLLAARILASRGAREEDAETATQVGARLGVATLSDGTVVRRPTHALDHLRRATIEQPDRGEAWRRLGDACLRYGREEEAEQAWREAVKVDPHESEAAIRLVERRRTTAPPETARGNAA